MNWITSTLLTRFRRTRKRPQSRVSPTLQGRFISEEANYEDYLAKQLECVSFGSGTVTPCRVQAGRCPRI